MLLGHTHLEIFVAFTPAEVEDAGIIAHEGDTVTGVHATTAEPALLDTHHECGAVGITIFG